MNKGLKNYLRYHWYFYLIFAFLAILFWLLIFNWLSLLKANEKLNIFIDAYSVQTEELETILFNGLEESSIKEINIDYSHNDHEYFGAIFSTRVAFNTDLIIINEDEIKQGDLWNSFKAITEEVIEDYFPKNQEYEYYQEEGIIYGVLVYDSSKNDNPFSGLISFSYKEDAGKYYLCLNPNSKNLGPLNDKSKEDDGALLALKILLSYLDGE
ncbi:MAG: hypothetical protein PHX62_02830 [Bacilli bacterium]|nr:hypothetical protein [Bacilli bacterium]